MREITMPLVTGRRISIAAAIVFVVFLVLTITVSEFPTKGVFRMNRIQPTDYQAIRNHLHKSRDKFQPANSDLQKLRLNGMIILPEKEVLKAMTTEALFQTYHRVSGDILCSFCSSVCPSYNGAYLLKYIYLWFYTYSSHDPTM